MGGQGQLFIQPSSFAPANVGQNFWLRGIPTPGVALFNTPIPAVGGIPTCRDLLSSSPPTLLELFEVISYSIGWSVVLPAASQPTFTVELALLVNDRVAYISQSGGITPVQGGAGDPYVAAGAWVADLVNPIRVGARDRLGLRIGLLSNVAESGVGNSWLGVGIQAAPTASTGNQLPVPFESTITYNVIDLPASRRL